MDGQHPHRVLDVGQLTVRPAFGAVGVDTVLVVEPVPVEKGLRHAARETGLALRPVEVVPQEAASGVAPGPGLLDHEADPVPGVER